MNEENNARAPTPRSALALATLSVALLLAFSGFIALGVWQLHRLHWKLDLIARVDARVHAAPEPPPLPAAWPGVTAARDEYRHVRLDGHYLASCQTRVKAVTSLGSGFWVMSPFKLRSGGIVLVNRGYIPRARPVPASPTGATEITGLLRMTEPGGAFLRHNDPAHHRWYSRDVSAIAANCHLRDVAPFFVDADAAGSASQPTWPRGGMTVTHFPNNHLSYALTWFALALLTAWAGWRLMRTELAERRLRSPEGQ